MISRLIPFLTIICAIGLFFGYVNPEYTGTIASLSAEIKGYTSALAAADEFKAQESKLLEQLNSIPQDSLTRLQQFLPDGVDNVQLILDLNALAARSGMRIVSFDIAAPPTTAAGTPAVVPDTLSLQKTSETTDSMTFSISATGTYDALHTFLASIERSLRPLDLVSFSLASSETGVYTYTMTFRIYWLR